MVPRLRLAVYWASVVVVLLGVLAIINQLGSPLDASAMLRLGVGGQRPGTGRRAVGLRGLDGSPSSASRLTTGSAARARSAGPRADASRAAAPVGFRPVSEFLRSYLTVGIFGALGVVIVAALLGVGRILRPSRPTPAKVENYESGVDPIGDMWSQANIRYYVFALLFVLFDVEAVFIFPWAARLEAYAMFGLVEMAIFIFILLLGLLYAWRKRMLRWV